MIADLMSFIDDPLKKPRVLLPIFTDYKETGLDIFCLENVEYLWRPDRVRSVVKGQRDLGRLARQARLVAGSLHYVGGRDLVVYFAGQITICVGRDIPVPVVWHSFDLENFAVAIKVDIITVLDRGKIRKGIRVLIVSKDLPDRRVLAAHSPECYSRNVITFGIFDLAKSRNGIEKPNGMGTAVVFVVFEIWVFTYRIKFYLFRLIE